jgi:signal transduction histidine kinase
VKAKNIYDVESEIGSYQFKIHPPWQRSWWAYTIYAILSILLILIILKFYTKRLVAQKEYLERVVKERTAEIEQQKEEIQAKAEKLEELSNFKEGMTGMIVHDLKNPLNTIINLSKEQETKQAGKQMLNMVLNILDVQKFESAQMKIQAIDFLLRSCVLEALHEVKMLYERKSIVIKNNISNKIFVKGDVDLINRVFINLLTNAIKYTPNNGKIEINDELSIRNYELKTEKNLVRNSQFIIIKISDSGQGIPADKLNMVFDKFIQVESKNSGKVRSTGLGLTFCKLAVEVHGGEIGVESEVGIGSTFWVSLPVGVSRNIDQKAEIQINEQIDAFVLTEEDKKYLTEYTKELHNFTVYEFSDIDEILNTIIPGNQQTEMWKKSVINALNVCNEEKYNELINL